jgi:two-component system sensor kinase FixL
MVHVSVEDTGPGVDEKIIDRIFHGLFTTKSTGMGMGLTICHSIIESHNGKIWVSNRPSGGAAFHFELPGGEATFTKA